MRFTYAMPASLKPFYQEELQKSGTAISKGYLQTAWRHLERAHIIGQAYPVSHTQVHWRMLRFGCHIKSAGEIKGQLLRLLVGGVKSFVGKIPLGNTGGANVPPLLPMEIPADLLLLLQKYDHRYLTENP